MSFISKKNACLIKIKSDGRILGPFEEQDVDHLLRSYKILSCDLIAYPMDRWRALSDIDRFLSVIKEADPIRDDTCIDISIEDLDPQYPQHPVHFSESISSTTTPIAIVATDAQNDQLHLYDHTPPDIKSDPNHSVKNKSYAVHIAHTKNKNSSKANSWVKLTKLKTLFNFNNTAINYKVLFILPILIFCVVYGLKYGKKSNFANNDKNLSFEQLFEKGVEEYKQSNWKKSLQYISKAHQINDSDINLNIYFAQLIIGVENKTTDGRNILENILSSITSQTGSTSSTPSTATATATAATIATTSTNNVLETDKNNLKRIHTAISLAHLKDGNFDKALEAAIKALSFDNQYISALMNKGSALFLLKNFNEALQTYKLIESIQKESLGYVNNEVILMNALTLEKKMELEQNKIFTKEISDKLEEILVQGGDYQQEAALLKAHLELSSNDSSKALVIIESLLDMDPYQNEGYQRDFLTYRNQLNWSTLIDFCQMLARNLESNTHTQAALGFCLIKSNKNTEGYAKLKEVFQKTPDDPLIQSLIAYALMIKGDGAQANSTILQKIAPQTSYVLPYLLQGHFCQSQKKFDCAEKQWNQVLELDQQSLSAISGLAEIYLTHDKKNEARLLIEKGLRISSNFQPLVQLNELLQKQ